MSKKRGLGKGLSALFPESAMVSVSKDNLKEIAVKAIKPNTQQPRDDFDDAKIQELADSIKQHGVIQPVVVRPLEEGGYEIIAGERRWRACASLGLEFIPAVIKHCSGLESSVISIIENIQREDLNPLEEANAYRQLIKEYDLTQEEVSQRVGKSRSFIANMTRLLALPDEIKDMIKEGKISAGHGRAILSLKNAVDQIAVAQRVIALGSNVRETEEIIQAMSTGEKASGKAKRAPKDPYILKAETKLSNILAAKVTIKKASKEKDGGKIVISYNNDQSLAEIIKSISMIK